MKNIRVSALTLSLFLAVPALGQDAEVTGVPSEEVEVTSWFTVPKIPESISEQITFSNAGKGLAVAAFVTGAYAYRGDIKNGFFVVYDFAKECAISLKDAVSGNKERVAAAAATLVAIAGAYAGYNYLHAEEAPEQELNDATTSQEAPVFPEGK